MGFPDAFSGLNGSPPPTPPPSKVHTSQNNGTLCAKGNEVTGVESDLGLARTGNESLREGYSGNLLILIFASLPASPVSL